MHRMELHAPSSNVVRHLESRRVEAAVGRKPGNGFAVQSSAQLAKTARGMVLMNWISANRLIDDSPFKVLKSGAVAVLHEHCKRKWALGKCAPSTIVVKVSFCSLKSE